MTDRHGEGGLAVVQPHIGIGDMVWHEPYLRALAATLPGGRLTLIAKPTSEADQILGEAPYLADILWLERRLRDAGGRHDGLAGIPRLAALMRPRRFARLVVLHHSWRYAAAARLAGIPSRRGYGIAWQRQFLNDSPFLDRAAKRLHPIDRAKLWFATAGITVADHEPRIRPGRDAIARIADRFGAAPAPWLVLGIGVSAAPRRWPEERFAALLDRVGPDWGTVFLAGSPGEGPIADAIVARRRGTTRTERAVDLPLADMTALLAAAALYVGNDTSLLNIAAATGVPAIGLFGANAPLTHSARIIAVVPADGRFDAIEGMRRIDVEAVVAAVERIAPAAIRDRTPRPLAL